MNAFHDALDQSVAPDEWEAREREYEDHLIAKELRRVDRMFEMKPLGAARAKPRTVTAPVPGAAVRGSQPTVGCGDGAAPEETEEAA